MVETACEELHTRSDGAVGAGVAVVHTGVATNADVVSGEEVDIAGDPLDVEGQEA